MSDSGGGQGPGGHPGAVVIPLTSDANATANAIMQALASGATFQFKYFVGSAEFAVYATPYKS